MSQARVYSKTEAGLDEVHSRQAGLNARVRQLLILVDGKRSVGELSRMMACTEFEEFLALLELRGLVVLKSSDRPVPSIVAPLVTVVPSTVVPSTEAPVAESASTFHDPASYLEPGHAGQAYPDDSLALAPAAVLQSIPSMPRSPEQVRLDLDRLNMSRLLQETVGPLAEDLCYRIARASRRAELAELFVASLTVVELMSGRKAADRFVEKMKHMGWEV
jgi:hypothetical protein